jgi:serine/threonine protein kinase
MVCGFLPFDDQDTSQLYSKILSGKYSFHDSVSDSVRDLINKILTIDQYKRATL